MDSAAFSGPLFVVGLPRSGTKLLRTLLANHPRIFAPPAETEFLPYWHRHWAGYGDLSQRARFRAFYDAMLGAPYFVYMRDAGRVIDCDTWFDSCRDYSVAGVFEALVRHDAGCGFRKDAVWCDKSPSYLTQVRLLGSLFPDARFMHIVRDVRDYCVSINRAWGKNMLRAAQRWTDALHLFRHSVADTGVSCHELRYEDLLQEPEVELQRACSFLGLPFMPSMLELAQSPENLGDTKGQKRIVPANFGKYETLLGHERRRAIERVARSGLLAYGYDCPDVPEMRLPTWKLRAYQIADGANLLRFEVRERGLIPAMGFRWRAFVESGNRLI